MSSFVKNTVSTLLLYYGTRILSIFSGNAIKKPKGAKMKILMIISELNAGGAETHVETLCTELTKMGHEVAVLSHGGRIAQRMGHSGTRQILIRKKRGESPFRH